MIRFAFSFAGGFLLIIIESFIVMGLKGYQTIEFGGVVPFMNVWVMNFFLLFTLFTHIKLWVDKRNSTNQSTTY